MTNYRQDIQALRALAVLAVIAFHIAPLLLPGGYLGVDIFFVISGFLITGIIARDIEAGHFTFGRFWLQRARRILPAAIATVILTASFSLYILSGQEQIDLSRQIVAVIFFASNFYFSGGVNYFSQSVDFSPLLHMWSLSVEEQYYLIFPLILRFSKRSWWMPVLVILSASSLVLCYYHVGIFSPTQTFYLPFTRAWQLGLGGIIALCRKPRVDRAGPGVLAWPALIALLALLYFQIEDVDAVRDFRPGPSSFVACIATAVLIFVASPSIERSRVTASLRPIGDMSYSLYLVHWPMLSLYRNATMSNAISWQSAIPLMIMIAVAAFLLHRCIELPLHRNRMASFKRQGVMLLGACGIALALSVASDVLGHASAHQPLSRGESYATFGAKCKSTPPYDAGAACRNSQEPEILIWGDSMALATASGASTMPEARLAIATRPLCGPFLTEAPVRAGIFDRTWALECIRFNNSVIEKLRAMPSVRVVALVSVFNPYIDSEATVMRANGVKVHGDFARTVDSMTHTVAAIRALGKRVVLLSRAPAADFDVGMCVERLAAGRLVFRRSGCDITFDDERGSNVRVTEFVTTVSRRADVDAIRFDEPLCERGWCHPIRDGVSVYHDGGHPSTRGSTWLAKRLDLVAEMDRRAR